MSEEQTWQAVDDYFAAALGAPDPVLEAGLARAQAAGLPPIQVSPNQGRLLWLLARSVAARRILEIGALGAYSTTWLGRALPEGGRLLTLEVAPRHAEVARQNLAEAGLGDRVEVRLGDAAQSLRDLGRAGEAPFDLVFIDADKGSYPTYLQLVLPLTHPGTLLVADNVVRRGRVVDATSADVDVQGVRAFTERLNALPNVDATVVQTVGAKGYDGFVLGLVTG